MSGVCLIWSYFLAVNVIKSANIEEWAQGITNEWRRRKKTKKSSEKKKQQHREKESERTKTTQLEKVSVTLFAPFLHSLFRLMYDNAFAVGKYIPDSCDVIMNLFAQKPILHRLYFIVLRLLRECFFFLLRLLLPLFVCYFFFRIGIVFRCLDHEPSPFWMCVSECHHRKFFLSDLNKCNKTRANSKYFEEA